MEKGQGRSAGELSRRDSGETRKFSDGEVIIMSCSGSPAAPADGHAISEINSS